MATFADVGAAILSGGATGLLGAGLQVVGNYFTDRQKNKHELALRKVEMDSMKMEAELALGKAQQEAQAAMAVAEQQSFDKSLLADKATYVPESADPRIAWVLVWIDFLRGLIRPAITVWMAYLLVKLQNDLQKHTGGLQSLPVTAIEDLYNNVILTTLYIITTVILWWFGTRAPQNLKKK